MRWVGSILAARAAAIVAVGMAVAAAAPRPADAADGKVFVMKMSTATINDSQHEWIKMFVAAVEKDSGGRIKGEIYPASQLGSIPRQIEGVQFGSIQGWVGPPEFLSGVDERFEVMSAPALVTDFAHAVRLVGDPTVRDLVLSFGANKGLHGVSLFAFGPSSEATRKPVHHLDEFKGLKIRVLASPFQNELIARMGGTPVAMTLGDVLPAMQQGAIDGTVSAMPVFTTMHYIDVTKTVTDTGQPFIFSVAELSGKWLDSLPADLKKIVLDDAMKTGPAVQPWALNFYNEARKVWTSNGGELIELPPAEQKTLIQRLASVGDDMSKSRPAVNAAFKTVAGEAAKLK